MRRFALLVEGHVDFVESQTCFRIEEKSYLYGQLDKSDHTIVFSIRAWMVTKASLVMIRGKRANILY